MPDEPTFYKPEEEHENIQIYGMQGARQYIVVTPHSEFSFTREEDARKFAKELEAKFSAQFNSKQEILKAGSFDRSLMEKKPINIDPKKHP